MKYKIKKVWIAHRKSKRNRVLFKKIKYKKRSYYLNIKDKVKNKMNF
jgi:hypothetical protein